MEDEPLICCLDPIAIGAQGMLSLGNHVPAGVPPTSPCSFLPSRAAGPALEAWITKDDLCPLWLPSCYAPPVRTVLLGLCQVCIRWGMQKELHSFLSVMIFLPLASTNIFSGRQGLSLRSGYCWAIFCSHTSRVWRGSSLSSWGVCGRSTSQPMSLLTSMMWLWERYIRVLQ